jgi:signal peptidase I
MKDAALDGNEFQEKPLAQTTAVDPAPSATTNPETTRRRGTDWWGEVKGIFWLILVVLGFHSFIAKPFYIPSESMLPGLRIGDRLVVTKFAYGWSFVSPTIPNPVAIFKGVVLRQQEDSWSVSLPFIHGRLFGSLPTRGDVVIVTPPGTHNDYIKRVIGLPGDKLAVRGGIVFLNGVAVKRGPLHDTLIPVDTNSPCSEIDYPGARETLPDGREMCRLPTYTETLPNGRRYETIDLESDSTGDPCEPRLPDGRQPRSLRRQPVRAEPARARRAGAVRESRRACGVHHLQPRRRRNVQPADLVEFAALGPRGHVASSRQGQLRWPTTKPSPNSARSRCAIRSCGRN